jgi:hypothetical protein
MKSRFLFLLAASVSAAEPSAFQKTVQPFIERHCVKCHGTEKQKGDVRLDELTGNMSKEAEMWSVVLDQIRDGLMPPKKEKQPDAAQRRVVTEAITAQLGGHAGRKPSQGNLVPHELLFGSAAASDTGAAPRLWRLSPAAYLEFVGSVHRVSARKVVQPFSVGPERGIKDFAALASIDEPGTEVLVRNATDIVGAQCAHDVVDGKVIGRRDSEGLFVELMNPAAAPTHEQLEKAVQKQFQLALFRRAETAEVQRLLALYEKCLTNSDRAGAVRTMLTAVLLRAEAMFRYELGDPATQQLKPREVAEAVSFALMTKREGGLYSAADKGELNTREQITTHVRRILDDPKNDKPRIVRFFREYFEYDNATEVFKDEPQDVLHRPGQLVSDTDRLVRHILAADRDVLKELLTTPLSFVNVRMGKNKETRTEEFQRSETAEAKGRAPLDSLYGFDKETWPDAQPVRLAPGTRLGILMQPSWLVAWSGNFDNDVVRRGRFIRERLLGGTVPDLPIGVAAQVPDDPHRTLRDRMKLTRADACWKCHQRMDDLGLPFENFDHYARFRSAEMVRDSEATAANVDKKGKPLGPVLRGAPLDTTGLIENSGDPKLDGPIRDPRELVQKLATSDRVRQVFIRHVFRYFLGRNESLADAATLQAADRAYVESGGSFKALIVSLLTSDSFLSRRTVATAQKG